MRDNAVHVLAVQNRRIPRFGLGSISRVLQDMHFSAL